MNQLVTLARRSVIHPKLARELGALGVRALTRLDVELSNTGSCIARAASPILATSARYVTTVGDSTNRAFRFSKSIDRESMTYDRSACRLQHSQPSQPETLWARRAWNLTMIPHTGLSLVGMHNPSTPLPLIQR
ncbi:hypothetical protein NUW54_g4503 [Trametes sanguinea]|uniref:Uncharacterized protein n=1 Tax=Trametes sanguinea TaxID=158606 RepID=A0ACC1PXR6_9APHY|nr:hypothetical protein NUW54_g4503 [Trametes sanguinea]